MATLVASLFGYSGAIVGTILMLPQVVKSWRTKQVDDLSTLMVCLYVLNCILWFVYGLLIGDTPVTVANFLALLISLVQLGLKMKYGGKGGQVGTGTNSAKLSRR